MFGLQRKGNIFTAHNKKKQDNTFNQPTFSPQAHYPAAKIHSVNSAGVKPVQRKNAAQSNIASTNSQSVHKIAEKGVRGIGQTLPYLNKIQQSFGRHDISQVKAYMGTEAKVANRIINAKAYTTGAKVAFAEKNPSLKIVAHEAAHIIQQRTGVHLKGGVGQANDCYERHADAVADAVIRGKSAECLLDKRGLQSIAINASTSESLHNARYAQAQTGIHSTRPGFLQRWWEKSTTTNQWQENGQSPQDYIPIGNYWLAATNNPSVSKLVNTHYNPTLAAPTHANIQELLIYNDWKKINDSNLKATGCFWCVAADAKDKKVSTLLSQMPEITPQQIQTDTIPAFNGDTAESMFNSIGLFCSSEVFNNFADLLSQTQTSDEWNGAIAWGSHIIRAQKQANQPIRMWDPQGTLGQYLIPTDKKLALYTFVTS